MGLKSKIKKFTEKVVKTENDILGDKTMKVANDLADSLILDENLASNSAKMRSDVGIEMERREDTVRAGYRQAEADAEANAAATEKANRDRLFQGNRRLGRGRASLRIDR